MKLYTEKEVRKAIELAQKCEHDCGGVYFLCDNPDEVLEQLTPIELPSDEEIEDYAKEFVLSHDFSVLTNLNHLANRCFQLGVKWLRDKLTKNK